MDAIGGYFELADCEQVDNFPHRNGVLLNTGRNALEYILRTIKQISHIYIPYFTCEVVLEPIKRLGIPNLAIMSILSSTTIMVSRIDISALYTTNTVNT